MSNYYIEGIAPQAVHTPRNADELAAMLQQATADGASVVPWGGGTRQHLGNAPTRYNLALRTAHLNRTIEYHPEDLVITVEAGVRLDDLQDRLAQNGQWLPWAPPSASAASIGGLLASGASGPLRLGYGIPRDWVLALRVALGDGRIVKSGARVVKNVAGYDSHKLHIGALGTLGVILEATFKTLPLPECKHSVLTAYSKPLNILQALEQLRAAPLNPVSLVALNRTTAERLPSLQGFMHDQPDHLIIVARFAGVSAAVNRQIREAVIRGIDAGASCVDLDEHNEALFWRDIANFSAPLDDGALMLRLGAPSSQLLDQSRLLEPIMRNYGWPVARMVYAGVGLSFVRWYLPADPDPDEATAALAEVRSAMAAIKGYAVVEDAPAALRRTLDIWGPPPSAASLMRSLKAQWDPAGILNPGRYVV